MKLTFKSKKLKSHIKSINHKVKDLSIEAETLTVFGVSKKYGITVTGKEIGKNLDGYLYFKGEKFAYNPYRINIGSIGLSDPNFEGLISPAYVVFDVDESIYPPFLLLYLKSNLGKSLIKWYGDRGGVRSTLRFSELGKVDFPDISFDQQFSFYQEYHKKELKVNLLTLEFNLQVKLTDKLFESILQKAIFGSLTEEWRKKALPHTSASLLLSYLKKQRISLKEKSLPDIKEDEIIMEIPDSWTWCRFGDLIINMSYGTSQKTNNDSSDIPVLRMGNVSSDGNLIFDDLKYISPSSKDLPKLYLKYNDIVFNRTNSYDLVGKSAVFKGENNTYTLASYLIKATPFEGYVDSDFLNYYLLSSFCRKTQIEPYIVAQTNQANFNGTKLKNILVPLPPYEEQLEIVKKINTFKKLTTKIKEQVKNSQFILSELLQITINRFLGDTSIPIEILEKDKIKVRESKIDSKTAFMDILELLKIHGKLHSEDLWKMSKFYGSKDDDKKIDEYYAELKKQIEKEKTIKEVENEKGYLELV